MADNKEDKKDQNAEAQPNATVAKSKKKRLIIAGLGGLLVIGAAIGLFMWTSGGEKKTTQQGEALSADEPKEVEKPAEATSNPEGDKKAEAGKDEKKATDGKAAQAKLELSDFGETYSFKTFHLNLGNPLENNYVRLEISVEYRGGDEQKQEIERRLPQLRDAVVDLASHRTREFLLSPDGKLQLRKDIMTQFNRRMKNKIDAVFITDLLIE